MPFTPYHFGPALLLGMLLIPFVDLSAILIASVILDLEPLAVLMFNLPFVLHGIFHTYLAASIVAILLTFTLWPLRGVLNTIVSAFGVHQQSTLRSLFLASLIGTYSHVFLDSFLYAEMNPFYPFMGNPFVGLIQGQVVYNLCVLSGLFGLGLYVGYLLYWHYKSRETQIPQGDLD